MERGRKEEGVLLYERTAEALEQGFYEGGSLEL